MKYLLTSVRKNGLFLQCIPVEFRSLEVCTAAVRQNGIALGLFHL